MLPHFHILVVDDDSLMRRVIGRALTRLGFSVTECADGVEAFQKLEERGGDSLLVMDYAMPKFNGAQVCEIIRTHSNPNIAQTPIIMLTAYTEEAHEVECLNAGADDYVNKPVNVPVLKARIETHIRLASLRMQLQEQKEELETWRAAHERDLEAARIIQQAIIPHRMPEFGQWTFAAEFQSLIQVGGDIYDWLRLQNGSLLVWIADATGHGASAALLTTFIKLLFRHAATEACAPAEILESVNRDFFSIFKGHSFLTAACAVLQPKNGKVLVAGAGHPPSLVIRRDGRIEPLESSAPPIGVLAEAKIEALSADMVPGDTLLLYTDGLTSLPGVDGERMTFTSFFKTLRGRRHGGAREVLDFVLGKIRESSDESEAFTDDLAAVALCFGEKKETHP